MRLERQEMSRQSGLFKDDPVSAADIGGSAKLTATLGLFADFLRSEGKTANTIKAFLGDMRLLASFTDGETRIADLKTANLTAYLTWLENERGVPCSRKTYARRVTTLKVYFKWLTGISALERDPAAPLRQRSGPAPLSKTLSDEQVAACIAATLMMKRDAERDFRPEFLFRLLLTTGIKKSEAGRLRLADIGPHDSVEPCVFIRHKSRDVYKERRIALDLETMRLLGPYQRQYDLSATVFACTTRNLEYILTDIGQRADVPFKLSFEVMRWTMALRDHIAGADEQRIREKLGLSRVSWYETGDKIRRLAALRIRAAADP